MTTANPPDVEAGEELGGETAVLTPSQGTIGASSARSNPLAPETRDWRGLDRPPDERSCATMRTSSVGRERRYNKLELNYI